MRERHVAAVERGVVVRGDVAVVELLMQSFDEALAEDAVEEAVDDNDLRRWHQ